MSTSIQEQDLIQRIKQLEQRLSDLERQQRNLGNNFVSTDPNIPPSINVLDTNGDSTKIFPSEVRITNVVSSVQSSRMSMNQSSLQWIYADTSTPELVVDGGVVINFDITGVGIINTGDFVPGTFELYDMTLVIANHDIDIPATITSTGTKGMLKWNGTHLYLCTATNTWRRVALTTW